LYLRSLSSPFPDELGKFLDGSVQICTTLDVIGRVLISWLSPYADLLTDAIIKTWSYQVISLLFAFGPEDFKEIDAHLPLLLRCATIIPTPTDTIRAILAIAFQARSDTTLASDHITVLMPYLELEEPASSVVRELINIIPAHALLEHQFWILWSEFSHRPPSVLRRRQGCTTVASACIIGILSTASASDLIAPSVLTEITVGNWYHSLVEYCISGRLRATCSRLLLTLLSTRKVQQFR
jgi:hypothetical protein